MLLLVEWDTRAEVVNIGEHDALDDGSGGIVSVGPLDAVDDVVTVATGNNVTLGSTDCDMLALGNLLCIVGDEVADCDPDSDRAAVAVPDRDGLDVFEKLSVCEWLGDVVMVRVGNRVAVDNSDRVFALSVAVVLLPGDALAESTALHVHVLANVCVTELLMMSLAVKATVPVRVTRLVDVALTVVVLQCVAVPVL